MSKVSVNVSARQLREPEFVARVATVLAETGLEPSRLAIEVTETAVFDDGAALDSVRALHALGLTIALDDFGTGHSSLGLLRTCPVDVLKVDKSFVDSVGTDSDQTVIATSLIQIANGLRLQAIAEGVETAEQAAELLRLGYRYARHRYGLVPEPAMAAAHHPKLLWASGVHEMLVERVGVDGRVDGRRPRDDEHRRGAPVRRRP